MSSNIAETLNDLTQDLPHPQREVLLHIISGPTNLSSGGYPFITEDAFASFLAAVPHLFLAGECLLRWLSDLENRIKTATIQDKENVGSVLRAIKVLQNIIQTAAITAPADLWVLRLVLSTHKSIGLVSRLLSSSEVEISALAMEFGLSESYLRHDFQLLCSRGILRQVRGLYAPPSASYLRSPLTELPQLPSEALTTFWYKLFVNWLTEKGTPQEHEIIKIFLTPNFPTISAHGWIPTAQDIEIGYRIVPLVLAIHFTGFTPALGAGASLINTFPKQFPVMRKILELAGYCCDQSLVTTLGARVFKKGPGPFGIIHAYHSYFVHHSDLLHGKPSSSWVARGENVAASQEANRATFKLANAALDRFAAKSGFKYGVFIEHAVGQGEATKQRFELQGEANTQYFGADLEDAAIDRAIALQGDKKLPTNMIFVRGADIGIPALLIDAIRGKKFQTEGAVMLVGNGFHEVRNQTNEKMVAVFSEYCQAEILILFTEESALNNEDLLATGWNTYHAGFRYVHDISGQGLRPALDDENAKNYSWKKCAELGGYQVLQEFTTRTRTIYPYPKKDGQNPSISVNYFCVPKNLCRKLSGC